MKKSLEELSRISWEQDHDGVYPGNETIIVGLLTRIAGSLETLNRQLACGESHFNKFHRELKRLLLTKKQAKKKTKAKAKGDRA